MAKPMGASDKFTQTSSGKSVVWLQRPGSNQIIGMQNQTANGYDIRFVPVRLTAGEIASPSAYILGNTDVTYQLDVPPYTRYRSNGTSLLVSGEYNPAAVAITGGTISGVTLSASTLSGTLSASGATITSPNISGGTISGITKLASGAGAGDYVLVATDANTPGVGTLQRGKLIVADTLAMYGNQTYIRQGSNVNTDYLTLMATRVSVGNLNSNAAGNLSPACLVSCTNGAGVPLFDVGLINVGTGLTTSWVKIGIPVSSIDVRFEIGNNSSTTLDITASDGKIKANGVIQPATNGSAALGAASVGFSKIYLDYTNTATGTTGAQTINKPTGRVNIAAGGTSVVVTNSLVTTATNVFAVCATNDTTAVVKNVVPASGSFTITLSAAATAETAVAFFVANTN